VLAGNHEYYNSEYHLENQRMQEICSKFKNVVFMNKKSVVYNNVRIIGTTLWSEIPKKLESEGINYFIN
jgi:hypothetical protein